ncbi:MAG: zeta toxin family protein [Clostridia bacterium]|nr:zeta toxin family protein [Clostridia bacterium]
MSPEEIKEIQTRFSITDEEFENMYKQAELLTFTGVKPSSDRPTAILTGGQPGAGKTGIIMKTKQEFKQNGADIIVFDLDSYRPFYKDASVIASNYPELYAGITGKAAGKVMERLSEKAIREGYSFVMEGTMGKSTYTLDMLQDMNADFNIVTRLMAVSREESLLSIFERYLEMRKSLGFGRLTTVDSHNDKFDNFTNTALGLEQRGVKVEIYERSNDPSNIGDVRKTYETFGANNVYRTVREALEKGRLDSRRKCLANADKRLTSIRDEVREFSSDDGFNLEFQKLEEIIKREIELEKKNDIEI